MSRVAIVGLGLLAGLCFLCFGCAAPPAKPAAPPPVSDGQLLRGACVDGDVDAVVALWQRYGHEPEALNTMFRNFPFRLTPLCESADPNRPYPQDSQGQPFAVDVAFGNKQLYIVAVSSGHPEKLDLQAIKPNTSRFRPSTRPGFVLPGTRTSTSVQPETSTMTPLGAYDS